MLLASGGFEHNERMRKEYQQAPIGTEWTVGAVENTGDGIEAGMRLGAAVALMDDAWWGPSIVLPRGPYFCLAERSLPGCILVNQRGRAVRRTRRRRTWTRCTRCTRRTACRPG